MRHSTKMADLLNSGVFSRSLNAIDLGMNAALCDTHSAMIVFVSAGLSRK